MPNDQLSFFPDLPAVRERVDWGAKALSLSFNETDILAWIIQLHNHNQAFDLDVTYSTGRMWRGLPEPKYKCDLVPQSADVIQSDARNLPFLGSCMHSVMFDPPFVTAPRATPGIIRDRFSCYKNIPDLWDFYRDALWELNRVLTNDGIIVVKCMDVVSGSINYLSHIAIVMMAQQLGLYVKDLFVLGRQNVLFSPNMKNQQHARKNHCYYLVLQKSSRSTLLNHSAIMPFLI